MHALILLAIAAAHNPHVQRLRLPAPSTLVPIQPHTGPCSIPLLNALVGKMPANPMPVKKPEGRFHILQVTPPAPPCENWGK